MTARYVVSEMLHFFDGTVAKHCTKEARSLSSPHHEDPPVMNCCPFVVPASAAYLASWQEINPSIRNVVFSYSKAPTAASPTLRTYTVHFSYRYGVDKQYISHNSTVVDAVDEAAAAYIVRDRNWHHDIEIGLVKRHEYAAW